MEGKIFAHMIVKIDREKAIEHLPELIGNVEELKDLVPDYLKNEAEDVAHKIYTQLKNVLYADKR